MRAYVPEDFAFARDLYFCTMKWAIEQVFGWDRAHQESSFDTWFIPNEAFIIVADGADAGWLQIRCTDDSIHLGSLYLLPDKQRRGIGTYLITALLEMGRRDGRSVTLAVMKINPAISLYQRLGFRIAYEDEHKTYMTSES